MILKQFRLRSNLELKIVQSLFGISLIWWRVYVWLTCCSWRARSREGQASPCPPQRGPGERSEAWCSATRWRSSWTRLVTPGQSVSVIRWLFSDLKNYSTIPNRMDSNVSVAVTCKRIQVLYCMSSEGNCSIGLPHIEWPVTRRFF